MRLESQVGHQLVLLWLLVAAVRRWQAPEGRRQHWLVSCPCHWLCRCFCPRVQALQALWME